jgi:hypothetical protein
MGNEELSVREAFRLALKDFVPSRLLRRSRMKAFPAMLRAEMTALSPDECSEALVSAADYCLRIMDKGDIGRLTSVALIDPSGLSRQDAENLYVSLEDLHLQALSERVSDRERQRIAQRFGETLAGDYKKHIETVARGYGLLMVRLSAKLIPIPDSTLIAMALQLHKTVNTIRPVAERWRAEQALVPGGSRAPWSDEELDFIVSTAKRIALGFPS